MSSSPGSFVFASFWAASRMNFCLFIASSSALIDFWRPTNSGTTMWGNTMISRKGRSGTRCVLPPGASSRLSFLSFRNSIGSPLPDRSTTALRRLRGLLVQDDGLLVLGDDLLGDQHLLDVRLRGNVVHHIEHRILENRPQAARPRLAAQRLARDRDQRTIGELEMDTL